MNDLVPSIGSRIQVKPLDAVGAAEFFAQDAVARKRRGDPLAQQLLGRAVGDRHGRGVALPLDRIVVLLKIPQRQPAGFFAGGQRRAASREAISAARSRTCRQSLTTLPAFVNR